MFHQLENPYFSLEAIRDSPSRLDGVDEETEYRLKAYGCELIQLCGILLKQSQVVMATAETFLHRFYTVKSLKQYNIRLAAKACLFIASKLEESPKHPRDVINVFFYVQQREDGIPHEQTRVMRMMGREYIAYKDELFAAERRILKEFGFNVFVEHPYKFLVNYLKILDQHKNVELAQKAWNYLNDSLRTSLTLRFRPEVIASGCIYMAAYVLGIALPESPRPWWELFDAQQNELDEIAFVINNLYKSPKLSYISLRTPEEIERDAREAERKKREEADRIHRTEMEAREARAALKRDNRDDGRTSRDRDRDRDGDRHRHRDHRDRDRGRDKSDRHGRSRDRDDKRHRYRDKPY